jgi:uracil-DNA glycosylase
MREQLPADWASALGSCLAEPWVDELSGWLRSERQRHEVYPAPERAFEALRLTPLASVRVVILGQDPYHGPGQAHGLAFSVPPGVPSPPSLRNIFIELRADLGVEEPGHGCLESWAAQGVLLLNTILTVRAHEAGSHRGRGWEQLTDGVIRAVSAQPRRVVFLLWGNHARAKVEMIDTERHSVLESVHPSPLSARRGFFGSRPFSAANARLREGGQEPIDWEIPTRGARP